MKNPETENKDLQNNYETLFKKSPVAFAICKIIFDYKGIPIDYRFLNSNPAFEIHTGLSHNNTIGKTVKEIYPEIEPIWIQQFGEVVLTGIANKFIEFNKNTQKHYQTHAFYLEKNKFAMAFKDVTKNKQLQNKLEDSEEQYRQLFDSMTEIFQLIELIFDENGKVVDYFYRKVNPAFEKLVGKTKTQLIGKRAKVVFRIIEDYLLETCEKVNKTGNPEKFENYGEELNKYYSISAWKSDKNLIAIIFTDITQNKLNEIELNKNHEDLEIIIKKRTADLENTNKNLVAYNKVFVKRELRMIELKKQILNLNDQIILLKK